MQLSEHISDLAKTHANNWKSFDSYVRWEKLPDGFAVVYTSNRDSDALTRSNARVIAKALDEWIDGNEGDVRDESSSHWACGHIDGFAIRVYDADGAVTLAFTAYAELVIGLEDSPVLDEDDFSREEQEEANQVWTNCYSDADRIEYIRDNRSQFEFHSFADMLGCVRGTHFAGYASELLS